MSDKPIAKMDFKELRTEVQLLRDELAIMKRQYNDVIYNLDDDNFSSRFVKEKSDMRAAIEINAKGISTKVSNEEFESAMTQTAKDFSLSVSALGQEISLLSVTTQGISSQVNNIEDGEFNGYTLFEQSGSKFSFTGNVEVITADEYHNTLELSSGHIQLYPYNYSYSLVDLGMYQMGDHWEPRMRFGRGVDSSGLNGTGWIYKTTNGFGMMYNTEESDALTIEFNDYSNAIEIIGNVNFSGGTVTGLPAGGVAVFG